MKLIIISVFVLMVSSMQQAYGQKLLKELAQEDQDYRTGKKVARTDADRAKIVLALIAEGAARTPEDKFHAALVLQHTGLTYCDNRLVSLSPDNYLLAHHLSKSAFEAGYKEARYLVAATIDRYLSFTEGYQKFGTNRVTNPDTGKEELVPIDRKTSDEERAKYGVPPLAKLLERYPEKKPEKKP